jgi:hypothetical protein
VSGCRCEIELKKPLHTGHFKTAAAYKDRGVDTMASKKPGNEGGIKNLFAQHVEKMALGVAVVMVFAFLYLGMRHKPLPSDREAAALERDAKTAKDHVHESTWDRIWRLKEWPDPVFKKIALEDAVNVDPKAYQVSWLDPPKVRTLNPRVDPRLMPVEKLEVRPGVIAALAVTADRAGDGGFQPPRRLGGGADLIEDDEEESGPPTLRDEQIDTLDKGFRPKGRGAQAVGRAFVAIRGIVPVVDQGAEYDRCFARAMKDDNHAKYAAERDRPKYIYAYIDRQEVGADGKPVVVGTKDGEPQYWKRMFMSAKIAEKAAEPWPEVEEPADPRYLDENLTMRPPPVLLQDYVSLIMHPDIPFKPEKKKAGEEKRPAAHAAEGLGGEPGFDPGGPGPGEIGGPGEVDEAEDGPREGADASKGTEKPAEYRLLRYYDFSVDPAKRYRYRVQLLLEDPNNPRDPAQAPEPGTLEGDVITRIEAKNKAAGRRVYWRETDWSEETAIVDFPPTRRVLAGEVSPARYEILGPRAKILRKGPLATVMALVWDTGQAVWVPGIVNELNLGSVVDFSKNVWVVDPLSLDGELRRLSAYSFETGFTVADIYGGEMLPSENRKSKLTVPGEVLLVGEDGGVNVRSEFDDADTFSLFHYTSDGEGSSGPSRGPRRGRGDSPHSVEDEDIL